MKSPLLSCAIFLSFLMRISADGQTSSPTCGRQSNHKFPWHVAIYHIRVPSLESPTSELQVNAPQYKCSGTLINTDTVLTAAHCVRRYYQSLNRENVLVSLAKQNLSESSSSDFLKALHIMQHPNYTYIDLSNDIAVIKLSTQVTFDNHVQPVCLWDSNRTELSEKMGKMGTVVGWGKTETGSLPDNLQQANMLMVDPLTCLESDRRTFGAFMSKNTFCAGFRNGTNSCITDTGGALTFEENGVGYIRGIVSLFKFGKTGEICDPNEYTLFTDVVQYLPWIAEVAAWKCQKRVSCYWVNDGGFTCRIHLNITLTDRNCTVVVENALERPTYQVLRVELIGNVELLPEVTDVFDKLKNVIILIVKQEEKSKFFVERKQLFAARRISSLDLNGNRIEEIAPDTFDYLSKLHDLYLGNNDLKVIHQDTFKKLFELRTLWLEHNNLEVLPEGLFRNNRNLGIVAFDSNKLKIIATDFRDLPRLSSIRLRGNECINEDFFHVPSSSAFVEIQTKIWNNCKVL